MTHEAKNKEANPAGLPARPIGHLPQNSSSSDLTSASLPENAYLPLPPGELYCPVVATSASPFEATRRSVGWGLLLCALFTIASAYSGLKVGQVMETAIPISILAIGLARLGRRRSNLLENVIITSIGGLAGAVVAGAIFTLPALYMLNLSPHPLQTIFICLSGGSLGVLFLIPLRRYFVREMHGKYPYPEATAIAEVLVTGEKGGSKAKLLLKSTAIAMVYDFLVTSFQVWKEVIDFQFIPLAKALAEHARLVLRFDAIGFILGLGYVMGLQSSLILCAGGVFSNCVLVPLVWMIGKNDPNAIVYPGAIAIATMDAEQIFRSYIRFVGVGAIATAGVFGIFKSLRVVAGSFSIAAHTFHKGKESGLERTDRDISIQSIVIGVVMVTLCATLFFATLEARSYLFVTIALLLTLLFSFFFTSVAANAIATTARNPVSGMTMLTIIISSLIFLRFGLSGTTGMFFIMAIAGMVCTALSVSGQTITDLKTGYWLGSTPAEQEKVKFLGVAISSLAVGLTIVMLAKVFQFGDVTEGDTRAVLVSPQASIMKALVEGFMTGQPVAYILFGAGAAVAVVMEMLQVPALVFALGMYLPLELNSPALVGGFLCYLVNRRAESHTSQKRAKIRERGIIIASGLMAGGALGGVIGAGLRLFPWYAENRIKTPFHDHESTSQIVSLVLFIGLCLFLWFDSIRVSENDRG